MIAAPQPAAASGRAAHRFPWSPQMQTSRVYVELEMELLMMMMMMMMIFNGDDDVLMGEIHSTLNDYSDNQFITFTLKDY